MSDDTDKPIYSISRAPPPNYNFRHIQSPNHAADHTFPQPVIVVHDASRNILGPRRGIITCPFCHKICFSIVNHNSTTKTHIFAFLLFITTCLCCIPYMFKTCKAVNHYCQNCGTYLGVYDK